MVPPQPAHACDLLAFGLLPVLLAFTDRQLCGECGYVPAGFLLTVSLREAFLGHLFTSLDRIILTQAAQQHNSRH